MKLITFTVPCYNSQEYMEKCIDSLLKGGKDVEILIVNDGSSDNTASIADKYANEYPDIIKAIHQQNKGHGGAVNTGLENATGEYFKVVDSDDWVDELSLYKIIDILKKYRESETPIDLLISNYVYEHSEDNSQNAIDYNGVFPKDRIFSWKSMKKIDPVKYIIMHSVTYKTQILRDSGLKLPEHTFYVDNLLLYIPLPLTKHLYYLDTDFYRYFIGRSDQSVNEQVMVKRIDQQVRVTNLMLDSHDLEPIRESNPKLARYMVYYLSIMYTITTTLYAIKNDGESDKERNELWLRLKEKDPKAYKRIRYFSKAFFMSLPGGPGKKISVGIYRIARKVYKFN